jgi:hypothetical protein
MPSFSWICIPFKAKALLKIGFAYICAKVQRRRDLEATCVVEIEGWRTGEQSGGQGVAAENGA